MQLPPGGILYETARSLAEGSVADKIVSIARKNLFQSKARLVISVAGMAFAIVLILILEGFAAGLSEQAVAFIDNSGAELIVTQAGVDNMQTSRSVLPISLRNLIPVSGVADVAGIIVAPVMFEHKNRKTPIMLIGYKPGPRLGAPWKLASGRRPRSDDEVVFDLSLARINGLEIGDRPELLGERKKIVGLSRETQSFMNPYVFVLRSAAGRLVDAGPTVSYFLVRVERPSFAPHVKTEIENTTKTIDVLTRAEMAANDRTVIEEIMSDPIDLMVGIAYLTGFLVIGLTVYTSVLEKLPEFGTIKAVGADNRQLYFIVWRQSLFMVVISFVFGVGLAFGAAALIENLIPRFEILLTNQVLARTFVGAVAMSLVAAFIPAKRVARVEPAAVFD